jgi:hypothetical protein
LPIDEPEDSEQSFEQTIMCTLAAPRVWTNTRCANNKCKVVTRTIKKTEKAAAKPMHNLEEFTELNNTT